VEDGNFSRRRSADEGTASMALESGSRLGPYEIVGLLGSGGMGEVYRARDPRLNREVAIKVLPDGVADAKHLRRFEQEACAAGALNHPGILVVYDVGTDNGAPYVVSELLEGHTLRTRLEGGPLPVHKAVDVAGQIARGLAAAHDKGIVHRDLKPQNIFITDDGRAKILDFGLAKLMRPAPLFDEGREAAECTESGVIVGTVGYMSPEQVRGEAIDHRSDVFAFGAVLYEMLSGVRAFRRDSAVETMSAILTEDPPEIASSARAVSPALARIVRRCLEKRAGDRFHSAHDLALALEAVSSGLPGPLSEPDRGPRAAPGVSLSRRHLWWAALPALLLIAGGLYGVLHHARARPAADGIRSVAVLPFENVGGDPSREYLSDGVAETLINELSRLPGLTVMARSTTFRFKGKDSDPRQVGRDLGVGAVLTGRVSLRGEAVVVGAELVDVDRGTHIWGEQYTTSMADISAVQQEIAANISRGLRLKLAPGDKTIVARDHTESGEAYRLYLLTRHELSKGTQEGAKKALELAQRGTREDPGYAPAYVALADAYFLYGAQGLLPSRQAASGSAAAATKALELDETLAEGHSALGRVAIVADWAWARGERELRRALELNPNSADAHETFGMYLLTVRGRPKEGIEHLRRAGALDPLSVARRGLLVFAYYLDRQYDQSVVAAREIPDFERNANFAMMYREQGRYEESIAEFRKDPDQEGDAILAHLGNTYARAGRVREARECLRALENLVRKDHIGMYGIALVHAGLGEKDQAFEWLERAFTERDKGMLFLKVDQALDPLRSDPRFDDLVRRMNFPS
jgi:serine/threonine-protein kinase